MLSFAIYLNGQKLCTMGLPYGGVMSAGVAYVAEDAQKQREQELVLSVGGLSSDGIHDQHFGWLPRPLAIGDELVIRVIEATVSDAPEYQENRQSPKELSREYKQMTLERLKKELESPSR